MDDELNSTVEEMACRELVEAITDYLEHALPEGDRRRFDAHLEDCKDCVAYVRQMLHTIRIVGELRTGAGAP